MVQRAPTDRRILTLALAGAALCLGVVLCELVARLFIQLPVPVRFAELAIATEKEGGGGEFDSVFEHDFERFWRLAPDVRMHGGESGGDEAWIGVVSNSRGLRDTREIPLAKRAGELRVLFLGDSSTFGWRLRQDETTAYFSEQILNERLPDIGITTINAGVPGYTIFQGWRTLETLGLAFAPDVVVVRFGFNDPTSWGGLSDFTVYEYLEASRPPKALRWSRLAELLWLVSHRPPRSEAARERVTPEEFSDLLGRIEATTRAHDIGLVVLIGAVRDNIDGTHGDGYRRPLQQLQLELGEKNLLGPDPLLGVVDTVPILQRLAREYGVDAVLLDRVHPTARANRAVAEALADELTPWLQARSAH